MMILFKINTSRILEKLGYYCLLWVYLPLYAFGLALIKCKLAVEKLKLATGIRIVYHGVMSPLSLRSKVYDVGTISTEEEIDFLTHRSPSYLKRMTLWTAMELSKLALKHQTIDLISDSQLCYVLLHTVFAHDLKWDEDREMFVFNLEKMNEFILFEGFYWEVERVFINPETNKVIIVMIGGEEFHSDCSLHKKPDYNLAKLHLQVCLTYYAPGLAHNYVHFVFPSSTCISAKSVLSKSSVLYQLLSPHFQFMERLNHQALRICHATSNYRTLFDRFLLFWKPFPITKEQFSGSMEEKLEAHYIKTGAQEYDQNSNEHVFSHSRNGYHKNNVIHREHALFPPVYVTDKDMQKIPYLKFLSQYYMVIREFVQEIEPHIDREEWKVLNKKISKHVPRFEHVEMVEAITTFIHLVAIVHSADHNGYIDLFAKRYGCMSIRTPFEKFSNDEFWEDYQDKSKIPADVIKKDPTKLIFQQDVMRMRCFINVFVDFIPSPSCELSLLKTNYEFNRYGAEVAERNFKSSLRALDGNLKSEESPIKVPRRKDDIRAKGMQLAKLDGFIRSGCY